MTIQIRQITTVKIIIILLFVREPNPFRELCVSAKNNHKFIIYHRSYHSYNMNKNVIEHVLAACFCPSEAQNWYLHEYEAAPHFPIQNCP